MTAHLDLQDMIRDRMVKTGKSYTAAPHAQATLLSAARTCSRP